MWRRPHPTKSRQTTAIGPGHRPTGRSVIPLKVPAKQPGLTSSWVKRQAPIRSPLIYTRGRRRSNQRTEETVQLRCPSVPLVHRNRQRRRDPLDLAPATGGTALATTAPQPTATTARSGETTGATSPCKSAPASPAPQQQSPQHWQHPLPINSNHSRQWRGHRGHQSV